MTLGTLFTGFKRLGKKKQKLEWTEEKTKREMQKPLWLEINKKELEELTRDIYNNQDNNGFKIIINKRTYDLKSSRKTTKSDAKNVYNKLIQ